MIASSGMVRDARIDRFCRCRELESPNDARPLKTAVSVYLALLDTGMTWTDREVTAWLDELLTAQRMAEFEAQLRTDTALQARVAQVIRHRDQGGNSIGEVWQRGRLSCPTRTELGGYLLGTLSPEVSSYIEFHLQTVGCRVCQANLNDLEEQSTQSDQVPGRRRKFFESSAGLLRSDGNDAPFRGNNR